MRCPVFRTLWRRDPVSRSLMTRGKAGVLAACLLALPLQAMAESSPAADPATAALAAARPAIADLSDASRLLAIGGSITEIIYALGEEGRLIARDSTSVFPEEVTKLPDIGYMRTLSPEGTLSVDPDGILMLEGSGPVEAIDVLRSVDIPIVAIPETHDLDGILDKVHMIGTALGVEDKADVLAGQIRADVEAATAGAITGDTPPRIPFVISLQAGKINASGTGTAADGIIRMAGAENAVTDYEGYKQLTDEALISLAPDIILTMEVDAADLATADELRHLPAVLATPAGQADRIISMDGMYLLGFGPRTAAAIGDLTTMIRGPEEE